MDEKTVINVENGSLVKSAPHFYDCKKKQRHISVGDLLWKVLTGIVLIYLVIRVEYAPPQVGACTCQSLAAQSEPGAPDEGAVTKHLVEDNAPYVYPGEGDYDDEDKNIGKRVKRSAANGQVQIHKSADIEEDENGDEDVHVDAEVSFNDPSSAERSRKRKAMADCMQCASLEEQEDMVRELVLELVEANTERKSRHRRTPRSRERRRGSKRRNRRRRNTTSSAPTTTAQSATTTNTHTVQAPRLPVYHMDGKEVESEDPIMNLQTTECPECREIAHGILDQFNRFKPKPDNMYRYWEENKTISDSSIARLSNGVVTIKKSGIYMVYAQIVFYNSLPQSGLAIEVNGDQRVRCFQHGPRIQRTTGDQAQPTPATTPYDNAIFSTCDIMQVMYLREYDNLTLVSLYNNSWTYFTPTTSNWGMILLSDALPVNPTPAPVSTSSPSPSP